MQLRKCHIENFGRLRQFDYDFVDGLNQIKADNGWGKSTLAAFIKAMFYGLPTTTKKKLDENERKRYTPWQGGPFGGNLVFSINQKQYKIERFFGKNSGEDTCVIIDQATGKKTKDFSANVGAEIFGLDAEAFERSSYIPQKILEGNINESIAQKLTNLMHGTHENFNYEAAQKILNDKKKSLDNGRKAGQIYDVQSQLDDVAEKINELNASSQVVAELQALVDQKEQTILALVNEQNGVKAQINQSSQQQAEQIKRQAHAIQMLQAQAGRGQTANRGKFAWVGVVLAAVCLLVGAATVTVQWAVAVPAFVLGGGLLLVVAGCYMMKRQKAGAGQSAQPTPVPALAALDETPAVDINQLQQREREFQNQIDACRDEKTQLITKINQIQDELAALDDWENRRENLAGDLASLRTELGAIQNAKKFLEDANEGMSSRFLAPMKNGLAKYLGLITDQQFDNLNLDTDFNLAFEEYGQLRAVDYYSQGYRDLIDLCLRFALVDTLYDHEKPFIVLDDPLVNLDDAKVDKAKRLLGELAKNYQLIYFACHESRGVVTNDK